MSTLALMQPYFFPHLAYYQLVNAVDKFIFYDNVNFIKNGWMHRNRILLDNNPHFITVRTAHASSNEKMCYTALKEGETWRDKILNTLHHAYARAPFYEPVIPILEGVLKTDTDKLVDLCMASIRAVCAYLKKPLQIERASSYQLNFNLSAEERILDLCLQLQIDRYVNASGGEELYNRDKFERSGVMLHFLKSREITYNQFGETFVPGLSIIDLLMFNSPGTVTRFLDSYELY